MNLNDSKTFSPAELSNFVVTNGNKVQSRCSSSSITILNSDINMINKKNEINANLITSNTGDTKLSKIISNNSESKRFGKNLSTFSTPFNKINQFNRPIKIKCYETVATPADSIKSISTTPVVKKSNNQLNANVLSNINNNKKSLCELIAFNSNSNKNNTYSCKPYYEEPSGFKYLKANLEDNEHELTKSRGIYMNIASSTSHVLNEKLYCDLITHTNVNKTISNNLNLINIEYKRVDSVISNEGSSMTNYESEKIIKNNRSKCNTPTLSATIKQSEAFYNNCQTLRQIEFMQKEFQVRKLKKEILRQIKINSKLNNNNIPSTSGSNTTTTNTTNNNNQLNSSMLAHLNSINNNTSVYKFYERTSLN
jgi:hypothetical protein